MKCLVNSVAVQSRAALLAMTLVSAGMQRRLKILALTTLTVVALSSVVMTGSSQASGMEATQISGIGFLDLLDVCDSGSVDADFAILMVKGDLIGCHFVFVEGWECSPSGTYREWGTEMFVGSYNGMEGTFETTYLFTAKLEDCDLNKEIFGRCQHPIIKDSGTGVFDGVTGRLDFKDDVETGELFYKGHLRW